MKTFNIGVGVKCNLAQTAMLNYALLRTGGVSLSEFMREASYLDGLFGAKMTKPGNVLQMELNVYEDVSAPGAKKQLIQIVVMQLAVADISLGEFECAVIKHFKPIETQEQA